MNNILIIVSMLVILHLGIWIGVSVTYNRWVNVKDELPEESGTYLVLKDSGTFGILDYSAKYRLFNCRDTKDQEEAEEYAIDVKYWHPIPKLPKEGFKIE